MCQVQQKSDEKFGDFDGNVVGVLKVHTGNGAFTREVV